MLLCFQYRQSTYAHTFCVMECIYLCTVRLVFYWRTSMLYAALYLCSPIFHRAIMYILLHLSDSYGSQLLLRLRFYTKRREIILKKNLNNILSKITPVVSNQWFELTAAYKKQCQVGARCHVLDIQELFHQSSSTKERFPL